MSNSESPTRVVDHITPLIQTLQNSAPHLPAFTVADVIVTPDPFRDVIRTEPAPDLPSLIGEIMPYLWEHTTVPTQILHTRTTPRPVMTTSISLINTTRSKTTSTANKFNHGSANQVNDSTIKLVKHKNVTMNIDHKTEHNILKKKDEVDKDNYEDNSDNDDGVDNDNNNDDDDDSFSFDSVFHYLFSGEPLTKSPQISTPRVDIKTKNISIISDMKNKTQKINETEETIEHRSEEDSNSVLDYINNTTSVPSSADKTTSLETYDKLEELDDTKNANSIEKDSTTNQSPAPVQTTQKYAVKSTTRKHYATKQVTSTLRTTSVKPSHFPPLSVPDPGAVSGLLKLAGCNIYGRMYRVGRIISELSGPCLECMCTEVGVQCRPLKC